MRKTMERVLALFLLSLLTGATSISAEKGPSGSFTLKSASNESWVVDFRPAGTSSSTVQLQGKRHLLFPGGARPQGARSVIGQPQLPAEVFTLGIPFGSTVEVALTDQEYEVTEHQLVAPYPDYRLNGDGQYVAEYTVDASSYAQNRFFPGDEVVQEPPATLRHQKIATVRVNGVQYNPATKALRLLTRASLVVRLMPDKSERTGSLRSTSGNDPFYEPVYKSMLLNYEQARQWRAEPTTSILPPDSTRDWFETGRTYFKIPVVQDGWYRVTTNDIAAAGGNPGLIDIPTLRMFFRGRQVPLVVRPDTSIEFHAYRNYGDSTYIDWFTDTSSCWLTWGGSVGQRFATGASIAGTPVVTIRSADVLRHFEENTEYFFGVETFETTNTDQVPGEGWFWDRLDPVPSLDTRTYSVSIDTTDVSGLPTATFRARVWSMVSRGPTPPPDHVVRFWLNDSLIGDAQFFAHTGGVFSFTIPARWLANGTNRIRVQTLPTALATNALYFDWFEVGYRRFLRARNNQLQFTLPAVSGGGPALVTVDGFTNPSIEVYDLSTMRRISDLSVTGDSVQKFSVSFKDTLSSQRTYLAMCAGAALPVLPLTQKSFSDIRTNAAGADYIILTHKRFWSSAQQLASFRQTTNGVRAKVIDVQDIYDEFNFGIMNATKLKSFLRHAFQNWPRPAPSYLLMWGDASWDFHRYKSSSAKVNYVPGYGQPTGDNWFVCFTPDTNFLPSMFVGRISVQTPEQAQRVVQKLIGYENYTLSDWNKNYLLITGGNNLPERESFNSLSESTISTYVVPPPLGATPFRVYKSTDAVIDGENKQLLKDNVRNGIVFMNFLGHSGGRIWGVDIGPPAELENTNGKLPFVTSVSCNVGAYADPSDNILVEDFVLADNRGAIGAWASATLSSAQDGQRLVDFFLSAVVGNDSLRELGRLTTIARYRLWQVWGGFVIGFMKLTPLQGDPLARYAVPSKPDLGLTPQDFTFSNANPTPLDSSVTVKLRLHNYGLVPRDSVGVTISDVFEEQTTTLINNKKLRPTRAYDSVSVIWTPNFQIGRHTLAGNADPASIIPEVNELNNIASVNVYVYANLLSVVKPLNNMVVAPGPQRLVVTSPRGLDSVGYQYEFQLDTVDTFDSPFLISSGVLSGGPVSGEWVTPSLPTGRLFFWRSRTVYIYSNSRKEGAWVASAFSTAGDVPAPPLVRWRQNSRKQFSLENLKKTVATDSGLTISPNPPIALRARSFGNRNDINGTFGTININDQTVWGYWWEVGGSFFGIKVNQYTGAPEFRYFPLFSGYGVVGGPEQADAMASWLNSTNVGDYVVLAVVFDGRTNVNENLYAALERLGSARIRQVQPGQSWAFIGRKGDSQPGMPALESLTNDSAVVSFTTGNLYGAGTGSMTTRAIPIAASWDSFHWRWRGVSSTSASVALLGDRLTGPADTLLLMPPDSLDVNLAPLNALTTGPRHTGMRMAALLSSNDVGYTPALSDWWLDMVPSADLAISVHTVGRLDEMLKGFTVNLPVTVHNIGYQKSDSARISVSVYDRSNKAREIYSTTVDSIGVNGSRSLVMPLSTTNLPRRPTLQIAVAPAKRGRDLVSDNNIAYYTFESAFGSSTAPLRVFADGVQIMDGDYVAAKPVLVARPAFPDGQAAGPAFVQLFVNNERLVTVRNGSAITLGKSERSLQSATGEEPSFIPDLPNGENQLHFRIGVLTLSGDVDTLDQIVKVRVQNEARILHVYNYPNPFRIDTYFTFVLTGSRTPEDIRIQVFTIAGRKVREILVPRSELAVGVNRIYWDGRDNDGDEIANGYYLYKVTMRGDGKTDSALQKLAKVK